jgi:hypothetical protein
MDSCPRSDAVGEAGASLTDLALGALRVIAFVGVVVVGWAVATSVLASLFDVRGLIPGIPLGLAAMCLIARTVVRWALFPQAVVVEELSSGDALSRSADIVSGRWWHAFAVLAAIWLIGSVITSPASVVTWTMSPRVGRLLALGIDLLVRPFMAIAWTLLFFDLSERHARLDVLPQAVDPFSPAPEP